jgi:hypothetical protein
LTLDSLSEAFGAVENRTAAGKVAVMLGWEFA